MADEIVKGVVEGFAQVAQNAATMAVATALHEIAKRANGGVITASDLLEVAEQMLRRSMQSTIAEVRRG